MAKKVSKEKFAGGGTIKSPNQTLAENEIMWAKAEAKAASNPWTNIMDIAGSAAMSYGMGMMSSGINAGQGTTEGGFNWGSLLQGGVQGLGQLSQFAMGGTVPIEAEGNEVVQTPDGGMGLLQGPSHEQGGIDMNLPGGTEIFSQRLRGEDGKTMAERKIEREKKISALQKKLDKNPSDKVLQKTLKKLQEDMSKIEEKDLAQMEQAKQAFNQFEQFAFGGRVKETSLHNSLTPATYSEGVYPGGSMIARGKTTSLHDSIKPAGTMGGNSFLNETFSTPGIIPSNAGTNKSNTSKASRGFNPFSNMTSGDMVGLFGQLYSTFKPMQNTLEMRAGDQPNINAFEDYGKKGLEKLDDTKQFAARNRDAQLQDIELGRRTSAIQNRNSARGVNTMRALNIVSQQNATNAMSQVYGQYGQAMQNILSQESALLNEQDKVVMGGEQMRDDNDRRDRGAFYSQMAKDITNKGYGLQNVGKFLNDKQTSKVSEKALNSMYNNFQVDSMTGEIKAKAEEVLQSNPGAFTNLKPEMFSEVNQKLVSGEYRLEGNNIIDVKTGKQINRVTGKLD